MTTSKESSWPVTRRVARTVVVVDLVESVRLIEQDEEGTVRRWQSFVGEVVNILLPRHSGRLVKSLGDGLMMEFETVFAGLACARQMLYAIDAANADLNPEQHLRLRVGAHLADVIVDGYDIYGSGVNLAARLATLARPGDIVISADVRDALVPGLDGDFEDLGDCYLKHISGATRAYRSLSQTNVDVDDLDRPRFHIDDLRPSLAVVPFSTNYDSEMALGDLAADEVIAALSRTPEVNVVSRLSTMGLRGRRHSLAAMYKHLGARYVVSGVCRAHGDRLRLTVELADAHTGHVVWADVLRADVRELLSGASELPIQAANAVLGALLSHEVRRARTFPISTLEGHTLLFGAITLLHRNSIRDSDRSKELLEAIIERHPTHPGARAWLAKWHVMRAHQGWSSDPVRTASMARDGTNRALDLDPDNSLALTVDGLVRVQFEKDFQLGESRYGKAIAVNPNESLAWLLKGALHAFRGEGGLAVEHTRRALRLSPIDPMKYYYDSLAATAAASAGEYESAISLARRSLQGNCSHTSTLRTLAISQAMLGRIDDARASVERLLAFEPGFTVSQFKARSPGASFAIGQRFADALAAAGVPK